MTEKDDKINGCGTKGSFIKPPYHIFFNASCNKHDEGYIKGGSESDRMSCDANFLRHMMIDTLEKKGIKRPYFQLWAILYFYAVRLCGKKYFNYKKD